MSCAAGLILVVEDDELLREALEGVLRLRSFDVLSAGTAEEALNILGTRKPDAAIVDLELAVGSGRDVVVRMPPRSPVIIFSGASSESSQLERLRPRTRVVQKPSSMARLLATLDEMLASARQLPVAG